MTERTREVAARFGLRDGQFFAYQRYTNLFWELDEFEFGFGDLRDEDITRIVATLEEGEVFRGWSEHDRHPWNGSENPDAVPRIEITCSSVALSKELCERRVSLKEGGATT